MRYSNIAFSVAADFLANPHDRCIDHSTLLHHHEMHQKRSGRRGQAVLQELQGEFQTGYRNRRVLALLAGVLCAFDMWFAVSRNIKSMLVIFTIMSLIYLFTVLYVFPLQAQFENTVKATIKNAFLMSIKNLPWTLLMVAITAAIAAGCYFSSTVLGLMLICVAGLHAYLCSLVFVHIFNEYMPEEEEKSDEDFHIVDDTDED